MSRLRVIHALAEPEGGKRSRNQRADLQDQQITNLHPDQTKRPFPGLMAIASPLSVLGEATPGWVQRLADARGI